MKLNVTSSQYGRETQGSYLLGRFTPRCSGKLFLGIPVDNCREISANCCSKRLRIFVYAILNDAETKAEEGNIKVIQEWDREGLSVQQSIVKPYQEPNPVLRSRRA